MVKIRNSKLLKLLIVLVDILLLLVVIRECKITNFCCTIFNLISPVIIGYVIAWILKPIVNKLSKNYSYTGSTIICYFFIIIVILIFGYFLVPFIKNESKHIILKTDNKGFFAYSLEYLSSYWYTFEKVSLDLHHDERNIPNIMTNYEKQYFKEGRPIYYVDAVYED